MSFYTKSYVQRLLTFLTNNQIQEARSLNLEASKFLWRTSLFYFSKILLDILPTKESLAANTGCKSIENMICRYFIIGLNHTRNILIVLFFFIIFFFTCTIRLFFQLFFFSLLYLSLSPSLSLSFIILLKINRIQRVKHDWKIDKGILSSLIFTTLLDKLIDGSIYLCAIDILK